MYLIMLIVFLVGYMFIVFEHVNKINKAAIAMAIGVITWTLYAISGEQVLSLGLSHSWKEYLESSNLPATTENIRHFITQHELFEHLADISSILFFLLGAMTIVELVDKYQGFKVITSKIKSTSITSLLWIIGMITFFMSAVLDNLTTTIIIITMVNKLISKDELRWVFASVVIIAANAGGAWSPIGDVTTIMLWIGGKITAVNIIKELFLPSLISVVIAIAIFARFYRGHEIRPKMDAEESQEFTSKKEQILMLVLGTIALVSVPVFKTFTHLPPFLGMFLGLSFLWIFTDRYLKSRAVLDKRKLTVNSALRSIDIPTILFFWGILSGVSALQSAGHLGQFSKLLDSSFHNIYIINIIIGIVSSIIDNVPLVAASMGMYDLQAAGVSGYLSNFVVDGHFWSFLAYCAGTGGSMLIIGSAAGVAAMGIEHINFIWYLKKVTWISLVSYLGGAAVYYFQTFFF